MAGFLARRRCRFRQPKHRCLCGCFCVCSACLAAVDSRGRGSAFACWGVWTAKWGIYFHLQTIRNDYFELKHQYRYVPLSSRVHIYGAVKYQFNSFNGRVDRWWSDLLQSFRYTFTHVRYLVVFLCYSIHDSGEEVRWKWPIILHM